MAKTNDLFRPEAVGSFATQGDYKDALKVMRPALWGAGALVAVTIVGGLVWSAYFTVPVAVSGQGIFLSSGGVADVVANANGQIHDLTAAPGDIVKPDTVVAHLAQPDVALDLSVARGQLADAERNLSELERFQKQNLTTRDAAREARLGSLGQRVKALTERRDVISAQREDLARLVKAGVLTRDRLLNSDQEILRINSEIADAQDELIGLQSNAAIEATSEERERLEANRAVVEARRRVDALLEKLDRMGVVRTPFGGRVVEAKANVGQMVQAGTPVLTLERALPGEVHPKPVVIAYVGASDGKKIAPGMEVEISPSTTLREEDGFIRGVVTHVSDVPSSSAGLLRTLQNDRLVQNFVQTLVAPFEVTIALKTGPNGVLEWSSPRPSPPVIDSGTLAGIQIRIRSTSLLALAIPALRYPKRERAAGAAE
jgi:HlyD family secretion protein